MEGNVLAQLKDIHQPPAISFWPLAPGWYLLLILLLAAVIIFSGIAYKHWLRKQYKQQILTDIDRLHAQYQSGDQREAVAQLSILLRRAALDCFPRRDVAGLHGEHWLAFLDNHSATDLRATAPFTKGCGRILISAPYQASAHTHADELFSLVTAWVDHNLFGKKHV